MDTAHKVIASTNNRGSVLVYVAFALFALVGVLGLSIDLGHLYVVRGELQNAADASALAGAAVLYKDPQNPGAPLTLDFARARAAATNFINQNKSDRTALTNGTIDVGYWNLALNRLESPANPTSQHVPAVTATISRSPGNNGGPVPTFFAKVFARDFSAVSSRTAVAVSGFPGAVPGGSLFPLAISSCMTSDYFSKNLSPLPITISSVYVPGGTGCYTGQWTTFSLDNNDVPTVLDLMANGNPTELDTGDNIWVQPGAKAALYKEVNDSWLGKEVLMAIVDGSTGISTHAEMAITGFATFHIISADQGGKTVTGNFIEYFKTYPGVRPGGAVSNTVTPPLLVQ